MTLHVIRSHCHPEQGDRDSLWQALAVAAWRLCSSHIFDSPITIRMAEETHYEKTSYSTVGGESLP